MANPSKAKGTDAEVKVVEFLRRAGWEHCERRALSGSQDKGDVAGIPAVVIEVKSHKVSSLNFGAYVDEATVERDNAHADLGVAFVKRRGTTDPSKWLVAMDGDTFTRLLRAAGY